MGECALGIIPGAICVPMEEMSDNLATIVPEYDRVLVFYCAGGVRSAIAADRARVLGYESTYSLAGGYKAWSASNID